MDTRIAFIMGQANSHRELMVFDWDKAARLISANGAESDSGTCWSESAIKIMEDAKK